MASPIPLIPTPLVLLLLLTSSCLLAVVTGNPHRLGHKFRPLPWKLAHATFYGGPDGSETTSGACGYDDTVRQGYGLQTAALSSAIFDEGRACGACFEIKCAAEGEARKWCKTGDPSIVVTATNYCPPNYALSSDAGGWCNPPRVHFDLTMPAFLKIAEYKAGIVPITYRRVSCWKEGGIRFTITGHRYFNLILVWNVAAAGDVCQVLVKANEHGWMPLTRNWGQFWQTGADLTGQSLSFRVITDDHRRSTSWQVAPRGWQFGQTYEGKNFPC